MSATAPARSPVGARPDPRPGVAVVIPARNESESLPGVLGALRPYRLGQVVVVDNGSTDPTPEIAREAGVDLVAEPRTGYGAACAAGLRHLSDETEIVVFLDADLADDPSRLPDLLTPIEAGEADLVIGVRPRALREPGSMTPPQIFGNRLATELIRLLWGYAYTDLGPFRAIRRTALDRLGMTDRRFGWTVEMQVRALEEGLRILEVAVPYRRRARGRSKISGTVLGVARAGTSIVSMIARLWWRRRRSPPRPSGDRTDA